MHYAATHAPRFSPDEFGEFADVAVDAIRRAYSVNAARHDPEVGDDAVVFAIGVYRNSWFLLEQEVAVLDGWSSSRPSGSLVIVGAGRRIHVYRGGQDWQRRPERFPS